MKKEEADALIQEALIFDCPECGKAAGEPCAAGPSAHMARIYHVFRQLREENELLKIENDFKLDFWKISSALRAFMKAYGRGSSLLLPTLYEELQKTYPDRPWKNALEDTWDE